MVRAIFRRWRYLQQIFNNDHDANEIFRFRLRTYFKNARKKMPDVIPEVLSKRTMFGKRKSDRDDLPHATAKRGVVVWGADNYLPSLQDGEDQNTISAQRVRLASQFNLTEEKRDPHIIRNLMNLTFSHSDSSLYKRCLQYERSLASIQFCNMKDRYIPIPLI